LIDSHFPTRSDIDASARHRLAFDELLITQLSAQYHKSLWQHTRLSHSFIVKPELVSAFISGLPYTLTSSQKQALTDILADLSDRHPMNRLLEGDVGSGKTVVAAIAAYVACLNGFRTLFLAPTQILAHQHYLTLSTLFRPHNIDIGLVTGQSQLRIKNLKLKIVVGTHALLSPTLDTASVGLVIIDEQHRFGVLQRTAAASLGQTPHILTMTATPIPRTIALTLYGDLDLSLLTEVPFGRLPVKTWVVPETKRLPAYAWIKNQLTTYQTQAFIVCPFIDDSETLTSVKAATTEFIRLQEVFTGFKLGLLHGRMTNAQKIDTMKKFQSGEYQLLVTTPVVEVGIDVPNASIMLIEGADRFGLAQLHQLRGRVGRSHHQSYCLLFSPIPTRRLRAMETHHHGLELAEIDLRIRGPGEIFGTSQHGYPEFKVADPLNSELVLQTHELAKQLLPQISQYPILNSLIEKDKITSISPN
jgi:ATP-dependent DNA helicase RecG